MDTTLSRPPRHEARPWARLPWPPRRRAAAGFTIVEVMVATFVMLFSISSAILVMQSGFRSLDTARKTTLAAQIMQSEMEKIRMLNWSQVKGLITPEPAKIDISSIFPQNTDAEKKILSEMQRAFNVTRTASYLADTATGSGEIGEIIVIGITITWRGVDGVAHERTSNTRYCKNGLYNYYYTLNKTSST